MDQMPEEQLEDRRMATDLRLSVASLESPDGEALRGALLPLTTSSEVHTNTLARQRWELGTRSGSSFSTSCGTCRT